MSVKDICTYETLSKSTVYHIIDKFTQTNCFLKCKQGGKKYEKITPEIQTFIRNQVDDNCTLSLRALKQMVFLKFGCTVCESTIHRNLKVMHFSLKMIKVIPEKRNDPETIEIRKRYASGFDSIIDEYPDTNIFFLDEVGFNVSMRVNKGRSKKGEPATVRVKNVRSKNISVCCAYSRSRIFHYEINHKPYNTESFMGYICNLFDKIESINVGTCIVIMDNVPFHKAHVVKNRFLEKGHVIQYLPPYSPMLNPCENAFSKWKNFVKRSNCLTEEDLLTSMEQGIQTICKDDCEGWYRNMKKYIRMAREGIAIND